MFADQPGPGKGNMGFLLSIKGTIIHTPSILQMTDLVASSKQELVPAFMALKEPAKKICLEININKTNYM